MKERAVTVEGELARARGESEHARLMAKAQLLAQAEELAECRAKLDANEQARSTAAQEVRARAEVTIASQNVFTIAS